MRSLIVALGIALVAAGPARAEKNQLPDEVEKVLAAPDSFELLSISPERLREKPKNDFHGWKVLGTLTVKDKATREKIVAALKKGIADSDGKVAACFNPRHGIRASKGTTTVDLVICYECLSMSIYIGDARKSALTTESPGKTFNAILRAAKVPLAGKAK